MLRQFAVLLLACAMQFGISLPAAAQDSPKEKPDASKPAILWSDPGDIRARDLFYGVGGKANVPVGPFTYEGEDKGGTSPKFDVRDGSGHKWKAKLGEEAKPEVAATRLLWAVGYFANENYLLPSMVLPGIAAHQKRGRQFVATNDEVTDVRLQRHAKRLGKWSWRNNRFKGTREFNGLRVMMALLNNWDMKDDNNAILAEKDHEGQQIYEVTDLGASFGTSGWSYTSSYSKNNLQVYKKHKFISKVTPTYVDLNFPTHPSILHVFLFEFPIVWLQMRNHWIGRHIPREDVRWIASLLGQLSDAQIRDAFRAAGYTPAQVDLLAVEVEKRIKLMVDIK